MAHASESQHWYTRDGLPAYTVKARDGSDRPATLRDARKFGYVPGVSTILGCADKPGLNIWKIDQAIMSALTLPKIDGETSDVFVARVKVDAKETARKAAEKGTAIHAAIQGAYEGEAYPAETYVHIAGAMKEVDKFLPAIWTAERAFAHPLGFGGKVDLSCNVGVVDFKTKEFGQDSDLKTWDEHAMQLAAYREGLGMPKARAAICYVSVTNPGLSRLIEIPEEELERGWECFTYLLGFWKAKSKYRCGWQEKVAA
jgi:hypothetical protein